MPAVPCRLLVALAFSLLLGPPAPLAAAAAEALEPAPFEGRYAFRTYGDEQGLGNLTVECLLQDHHGFLWVGTQDGLFRFDGRRFARFGRAEGLPSSRINTLHETARGRLYAGTRGGLAVLAGAGGEERFQPLGPSAGLPAVAIPDQGITSEPDGRLYVATPDGLWVRDSSDGARFVRMPTPPSAETPEVTGLHRAPDGALYFAHGRRLFRRLAGRSAAVGGPDLPLDERIDQIATDGAGRLWLRTLSSLWVAAPGTRPLRFVRDDVGLPAGVGSGRLALDGHGRLLVPTARGLAWRTPAGWRLLGHREGLESETVLAALVDREGSLWISLAGVGLAQQLGRGAFSAWSSAEGLSHDVVWAIARQRSPAALPARVRPLWIGTEEGLSRLDPRTGEVRVWTVAEGLGGNTVYALAAAADGSVWVGTWPGGVTRLDPATSEVRRYDARGLAAADFKVIALFRDRRGALWAGTASGAYRLEPGGSVFEPVPLPGRPDELERDSLYAFAEDRAGTLWAAGRHGLLRLSGPSPRRFRSADGLLADFVSSLVSEVPAPRGGGEELVLGYREALGAARVRVAGDRLQLTPLSTATGLSFDKVLFLGRDTRGALWLGGGAGVDVIAPGGRPEHFGRTEGLITEDMSQNAFLAEADGTVWLGTSRGLVRYRPGREARRAVPVPILLTEIEAGGRRVDSTGGPVVLGRGERALTVAWAAPTFLDPRRLRFRYRLIGLEEAVVETSAHEVRFPPLPTGSYRLEVVAVLREPGGGERVSPRPAVFAFSIAAAWWERWWARGAGLGLLVLAGWGGVRLRTAALEADRRRLEAAVEERSAALARAVRELEEASFTDPLTRVRNRRFLTATVEADRRMAGASGAPGIGLVIYLIDIDHFKSVNDSHGHHVGDRLLVEVAARLTGEVRAGDLLVRWGGEEFLVVARGADRESAWQMAERLVAAVGEAPFDLADEAPGGLRIARTCSVGWAPFPWSEAGSDGLSFEQVLTLADGALYAAKRSGRNRAVGVLPLADAGSSPEGWWQRPLAELEGRWLRLVCSRPSGRGDRGDAPG